IYFIFFHKPFLIFVTSLFQIQTSVRIVSLLLLTFLFFFGLIASAQINIEGLPPSFNEQVSGSGMNRMSIPNEILPILEMKGIYREDSLNEQKPNIPYRFGIAREVDFGLDNSGVWNILSDGS